MTEKTARVLVVEDITETATRLAQAIRMTPGLELAGSAATLAQGLSMLARERPDFLLTDLGLPDGSGVELIRAAATADWICESMVFSVFGDEARVVEAIRAGAKGYILKSSNLEYIGSSVRSVLAGGSPISPKIARHLLGLVALAGQSEDVSGILELTDRETEVLRLLAKGYKRQEVGERLGISVGTVGTHVNRIYRKLQVESNTQAIARAGRIGLL
ncbi:LuxR C-terminal-related transcriptional regulator [Roseovarius dicentrarchi]|uniref:LuxR C-terminal-related transcriptional regulator n=1 Tax=Roseovarius dicentrarchi TaxID=2250573 RepID=UPI000DE95012|nr:response regulator transcription factor [Roseovarius dicentrarchi]